MKQYPYRLTERNISSLVSEYNNIYTGLLEQIDRCYLRLKEKSSAAEELEQQSIDAEKEAHDIYASFCSAEEIIQALFFSEDQARSAMERAYCLDWDGEDAAAYADTMRANAHLAEEQLLHRKNIRINTQLEASKLEMQTAIAKAEAMISKLRFIIAAEEKTAMENKILQKEA